MFIVANVVQALCTGCLFSRTEVSASFSVLCKIFRPSHAADLSIFFVVNHLIALFFWVIFNAREILYVCEHGMSFICEVWSNCRWPLGKVLTVGGGYNGES